MDESCVGGPPIAEQPIDDGREYPEDDLEEPDGSCLLPLEESDSDTDDGFVLDDEEPVADTNATYIQEPINPFEGWSLEDYLSYLEAIEAGYVAGTVNGRAVIYVDSVPNYIADHYFYCAAYATAPVYTLYPREDESILEQQLDEQSIARGVRIREPPSYDMLQQRKKKSAEMKAALEKEDEVWRALHNECMHRMARKRILLFIPLYEKLYRCYHGQGYVMGAVAHETMLITMPLGEFSREPQAAPPGYSTLSDDE
ncbi:hypothetical protein CMQ_6968 [Grosmannia clavigera kw1407]|uniref:Uncharacterized protein n=1 Tax=Grosmannia clavigera (strain kw1407 / UAMH 11150) TaxID=655863 RepID=F0X763_GROCL|nr:uncharacterized protein CMQ_6968 [Grosmannia clavigera kw1407]EFX06647.1 hypothetical protein CMQ_6968 [Grosmannia clavigera kw1407]